MSCPIWACDVGGRRFEQNNSPDSRYGIMQSSIWRHPATPILSSVFGISLRNTISVVERINNINTTSCYDVFLEMSSNNSKPPTPYQQIRPLSLSHFPIHILID